MKYPALVRILKGRVSSSTLSDLDESTDLDSYGNHLSQAIQAIELAISDVKAHDPEGDEIAALEHCKEILSIMAGSPGEHVDIPGVTPEKEESEELPTEPEGEVEEPA